MRFNKSFARSLAGLTFSLLLLLAAFARPALAQSDDATSPDSKTPFSKLSVAPKSVSFSVDIDKGQSSKTNGFKITNGGTDPLQVNVVLDGTSSPDYSITSGGGMTTIPGKVKGSKNNEMIVERRKP